MRSIVAVALLATACATAPIGPSAEAETPIEAPGALPDMVKTLKTGKCNNGPGGAGADSYYTGDLKWENGQVTGTETWHIFKNNKWHAKEARDCIVTYTVTGSVVSPVDCKDCEVALKLYGEAQHDLTTCHINLYSERGARSWHNQYEIKKKAGGAADVFQSPGGKQFASGHHAGDHVVYASPHRCLWF